MLEQGVHADQRAKADGEPALLIEEVVREVVMRVGRFGEVDLNADGQVDQPQSLLAIAGNVRELDSHSEPERVLAEPGALAIARAFRIFKAPFQACPLLRRSPRRPRTTPATASRHGTRAANAVKRDHSGDHAARVAGLVKQRYCRPLCKPGQKLVLVRRARVEHPRNARNLRLDAPRRAEETR